MGAHRSAEDGVEGTAHVLGVPPDDLIGGLDLVQASRVLGIAPSTLRSRALAGKIGYRRDGRAWRFMWWHLRDYVVVTDSSASETGVVHGDVASGPRRGGVHLDEGVLEEAKRLGLL
jgi:hypothetical protein